MGVGVLFIPEPWCPSTTDARPLWLDVVTSEPRPWLRMPSWSATDSGMLE